MPRTLVLLLLFLPVVSYGQQGQAIATESDTDLTTSSGTDASVWQDLEALFSTGDSLAIFELFDSLLQDFSLPLYSQLSARLGYNSNVASSGRTLGIDEFGLSAGLSYYHKSGLYADASTYWSNEFDPGFYLSIFSAGYLRPVTKRWSLLAEYNRFLYNFRSDDDIYVPYKNSLGIANFLEFSPVTFRLDYSFYFGEKAGHRIIPGMFISIEKENWGKINRMVVYPTASLMLGSEQVIEYVPNAENRLQLFFLIRNNLPLFSEVEQTRFGVMNYSFSLPVSLTINSWNIMASYTYNLPRALPGETLGLTNSGYLSAALSKTFNLNK